MARVVAFLRGINLGRRRVKMDELREAFEALALERVATFLASGNVVFEDPGEEPAALERRIEALLGEKLGYTVATHLRSLVELRALSELEILKPAREGGFRPHVIFLRKAIDAVARDRLEALEGPDDRFFARRREVLWLRRGRLSDSEIRTPDLESALGTPDHTMRNLNTIDRMVAKFTK